jgi:hypothetical protein
MLFKSASLFLLSAAIVSATECPSNPAYEFLQCSYITKDGKEVPLDDKSTIPIESACTVQCTGNYGKEDWRNGVVGIGFMKFSLTAASLAADGDYRERDPTTVGGKTYKMNSRRGTCVKFVEGEKVTVQAVMKNTGEVCAAKHWPVTSGCPYPQYELFCVESVNPSGETIPTAGTSLEPKVSPHQNPDGFYTFGFVDKCVEPKCIPGFPVTLYSGLGPNGETDKLSAYTGLIQNLRTERRGYQSCDTIKYTQFADGTANTEKKIGSDSSAVLAHLQGSGDLVVKAKNPTTGLEMIAFCRVPKPPARE